MTVSKVSTGCDRLQHDRAHGYVHGHARPRCRGMPFFGSLVVVLLTFSSMSPSTAFLPQAQSQRRILASPPSPPFVSNTNRGSVKVYSDVPRDNEKSNDRNNNNNNNNGKDVDLWWKWWMMQTKTRNKALFDWKLKLPPPPEDGFIMTGDVLILFLYGLTSHTLNNLVVTSVLENTPTIQQAIQALDPMGMIVPQRPPVWLEVHDTIGISNAMDSLLKIQAQESLLQHWGPLFSSAGVACVALTSCWLLAGWFHESFLFKNSLDCSTTRALEKTATTWITMVAMMLVLSTICNFMVDHYIPFGIQQEWLGLTGSSIYGGGAIMPDDTNNDLLLLFPTLTKADMMFLVDSATVLISWRFMANAMMNYFR